MKNPNTQIATYEDYLEIIGVPKDKKNKVETKNRINKWLVQATDQFDSMISDFENLGKLYRFYDDLQETKEDNYKKYKLKKAICSWVETFILNGKIWTDGVPQINSNIDIDIQSSSDNSDVETKRKDIIQDLVSLGLYKTTNLTRGGRNDNDAKMKAMEDLVVMTKADLDANYLKILPQAPLKGPLDLAANEITNGGNITGNLTQSQPSLTYYNLVGCYIDFSNNNAVNFPKVDNATHSDTSNHAGNADNATNAENAKKIWEPRDQVYRFIDTFPISYWNGMTRDEIYNAIYATGILWDPHLEYKKGWITQKVNKKNVLVWYQALQDNTGLDPELNPQYWKKLSTQDIDINAIVQQITPQIEALVSQEVMRQLGLLPLVELKEESKDQILTFKDINDFNAYKTANNLTDQDFEDFVPPITPLPNNVVLTDNVQTITGQKTWTSPIWVNKNDSALVLNSLANDQPSYIEFKKNNTRKGYVGIAGGADNNVTLQSEGDLKLTAGANINVDNKKIINLGNATADTDAMNKRSVVSQINSQAVLLSGNQTIEGNKDFRGDIGIGTRLKGGYGGGALAFSPEDNTTKSLQFFHSYTGPNCYFNIDMGNKGTINNLKTPTLGHQAATKDYVDTHSGGGQIPSNVVLLDTAQTITGVKTFNVSPIVPTPSQNTQAVNKEYVDTQLNNKPNRNEVVDLNRRQIISGEKNFTTLPKSGVTPTTNQHLTNKEYVDNNFVSTNKTEDINGSKTFRNRIYSTQGIDMSFDKIYQLGDPVSDDDAANKRYVDNTRPVKNISFSSVSSSYAFNISQYGNYTNISNICLFKIIYDGSYDLYHDANINVDTQNNMTISNLQPSENYIIKITF